eukprot:Gb_26964 [translate_table: standard]
MSSLSRLGIGLSVVFGCFLLALLAEVYYMFWWRRRTNSAEMTGEIEDAYSSPSRELLYLLCWKKQGSLSTRALNPNCPTEEDDVNGMASISINDEFPGSPESPLHSDYMAKFFPLQTDGMDSELMRIHSLLGPPRILFTIKEETKEDLDSEDGKSRGGKSRKGSRSRSLSDLFGQIGSATVTPAETPFMTPSSSPPFHTPFTTPPLTPLHHQSGQLIPHPGSLSLQAQKPQQPNIVTDSAFCPPLKPDFPKFSKNPDDQLSQVDPALDVSLQETADPVEMDDGSLSSSPPSNSPAVSGDENASFITIFVNDDSYKLKS